MGVLKMSKKVKYICCFSACIVALFVGAFAYTNYVSPITIVRSNASYASYDNINDLTNYADLIVIAKPTKDITECEPTIRYTSECRVEEQFTITPFKVLKTLKGAANKNIDVIQPAVILTQGSQRVMNIIGENYTVANKNNKYVLYLKKVDNKNIYSLISLEYGKYNLDGKDSAETATTDKSQSFKKIKDSAIQKYKSDFDSVN